MGEHRKLPVRPCTRYNPKAMHTAALVIGLVLGALFAGCAGDDGYRWLKTSGTYTTEEFRNDVAECSRNGKLDESCMQRRGWERVRPSAEKPAERPSERPDEPSDRRPGVTPYGPRR